MLNKIKFLFRCIVHMDYKSLFNTVSIVHKASKKNSIYLFYDIVKCGFKYGAGHSDYLLCEFYNLNSQQRATYVTRGVNNAISKKMNNPDVYYIYHNKDIMYKKYANFIKRDWLFIPETDKETFAKFMSSRDEIIIKPSDDTCGNGVEKLKKADYKSVDEMYDYISSLHKRLVEDVIVQHDDLKKLNPKSVNTIRAVTIYSEGAGHLIYTYIRIGNSDRPVDNLHAGGMCAPIDIDTGIITQVGYDRDRNEFVKHPKTGCLIKGYKIPYWDEVIKTVTACSEVVPEMGYLGWDIAITPTGVELVEANDFPGHDFLQMPPHVPDKIGMLPQFNKYVK